LLNRPECPAIRLARRLGKYEVIEALAEVMLCRGIPEHIRSDNGPEFVAKELRKWLGRVGVGTLYIEPGSPLGYGYPTASQSERPTRKVLLIDSCACFRNQ